MNRSVFVPGNAARAEVRSAMLGLLLLVSTLLAAGCRSKSSEAQQAGPQATARVAIHRIAQRTFQRQVEFPATLLAAKNDRLEGTRRNPEDLRRRG